MMKSTSENHYRIIFRGELLEGKDQGTVKKNLAALFKIPPAQADRFFAGKPITIKTNVNEETARKYYRAFTQAGAVCRIVRAADQTSHTNRQEPSYPGDATVVTLKKTPGSILYQPFPLVRISGDPKTLTITKNTGQQTVLFAEVIAATALFHKEDSNKLKVIFYIKDEPRPLIALAGNIHFQDFPNVTGENTLASLRNFLTYLRMKNPALLVDEGTNKFLHWSMPMALDKSLFLSHVTALAKHLEQRGFIPKKEKPTIVPTPPAIPVEEPAAVKQKFSLPLHAEDSLDEAYQKMEPEEKQEHSSGRFSLCETLRRGVIAAKRMVQVPFLKRQKVKTALEKAEDEGTALSENEQGDEGAGKV